MTNTMLWQPRDLNTQLHKFAEAQGYNNYQDLWQWSVSDKAGFWNALWEFADIQAETKGGVAYQAADHMKDDLYFPQAKLNYAENLLRRRDAETAIYFKSEDAVSRQISYAELYDQVSCFAQNLKNAGVEKGDRVAGYMPNMPETIIAMLATASLGAIWSSASPDFGVQGVIDRFGQIEPKIMIASESYRYNGKTINVLDKLVDILPQMPSIEKTIIVPFMHEKADISMLNHAVHYSDFTADVQAQEIIYTHVDFKHPLFIMFSSGTTGVPKCIVHGHGGTLLQHVKEHRLHSNTKEGDKAFYFTTCGWMMWNWLVSALACGASLMLYDGSPFYPDGNVLFDYADEHGATLFGTSAKYIDALKKQNYSPKDTHDLSTVRVLASTGSPLVHEGFDYIYEHIKSDLHLASISGGTDIVSCFVLGNPMSPVHRGEIQGPGLGMDVDVLDVQGKPMSSGTGELACKTSFPAMPVGFWKDQDDQKYMKAYFNRFDNIWCHGDWCEWTDHKGLIIHGRSDATLNPGGVRIGTAEIYRQVEKLPEVKESIAIGQEWDDDVRVVLFVVLNGQASLDDDLIKKIKTTIREGATPRHTPAVIVPVQDIPRTKSGKITEIAVRDIVHGREVANIEALANPEALDEYKDRQELQA